MRLSKLLLIYTGDGVWAEQKLSGYDIQLYKMDSFLPLWPALEDSQVVLVDIQESNILSDFWSEAVRRYAELPLLILLNAENLAFFQEHLLRLPATWDWLPRQLDSAVLENKLQQCWSHAQSSVQTVREREALLHLVNGPLSPLEGYLEMFLESVEMLSSPSLSLVHQALFCLKNLKQRIQYLTLYQLLEDRASLREVHHLKLQTLLDEIQTKLSCALPTPAFLVNEAWNVRNIEADREVLERMMSLFLTYLTQCYQHIQVSLQEVSQQRFKRRLGYPLEEHQALGFVDPGSASYHDGPFLEIHFQFQGSPEMALIWQQLIQQQMEQESGLEPEILSRLIWRGLALHQAWAYVEWTSGGLNHVAWGFPIGCAELPG